MKPVGHKKPSQGKKPKGGGWNSNDPIKPSGFEPDTDGGGAHGNWPDTEGK